MTTYIAFEQPSSGPFSTQITLDGTQYTFTVTWNIYGRYYINIYDLSDNLIVCEPRIGSPIGYDINLALGYFTTSTLIWRPSNNNFEVNP